MTILEAMDNVLRTSSEHGNRTGCLRVRKQDWLEVLLVGPTGRYASTIGERSYRGFTVEFGDLDEGVSASFILDPPPPPDPSGE